MFLGILFFLFTLVTCSPLLTSDHEDPRVSHEVRGIPLGSDLVKLTSLQVLMQKDPGRNTRVQRYETSNLCLYSSYSVNAADPRIIQFPKLRNVGVNMILTAKLLWFGFDAGPHPAEDAISSEDAVKNLPPNALLNASLFSAGREDITRDWDKQGRDIILEEDSSAVPSSGSIVLNPNVETDLAIHVFKYSLRITRTEIYVGAYKDGSAPFMQQDLIQQRGEDGTQEYLLMEANWRL